MAKWSNKETLVLAKCTLVDPGMRRRLFTAPLDRGGAACRFLRSLRPASMVVRSFVSVH